MVIKLCNVFDCHLMMRNSTMAKAERNTNIFHLLRIAKGLSIKELAEQLSITPAYIHAIENGEKFPSDRLLRDYAKALEVDENIIRNFSEENCKGKKFEQILLSVLRMICDMPD